VANHVAAKRYLTATDAAYLENLSEASKKSLKQQGGPMSQEERGDFQRMEGWRECIEVRRWDDLAKEVGVEESTPRVGRYKEVVERVLSR
jgi:predicted HD phosphohydrolase